MLFRSGPDVGRASPDSNALRLAFTTEEHRTQRRSDGTLSLNGQRFEIPARYRLLSRVAVRYASWDLTHVHLVDVRAGTVLARLYPLDKAQNADGRRRTLPSGLLDPAATVACRTWSRPVGQYPKGVEQSTHCALHHGP